MEKDTKYCHIAEINNGVVFSDPAYDKTVWCQYRKEFQDKDWLMKLESSIEDGILLMNLYLGRPTFSHTVGMVESKEGLHISYPRYYQIQETELGIDTARIFLGTKENWEEAREEAAVYTAADGLFGDALEFTCKGETRPCGYLIIASVDAAITNPQELFQLLSGTFNGREITKEDYLEAVNPNDLQFKRLQASEIKHAQKAMLQKQNISEQKKQNPER